LQKTLRLVSTLLLIGLGMVLGIAAASTLGESQTLSESLSGSSSESSGAVHADNIWADYVVAVAPAAQLPDAPAPQPVQVKAKVKVIDKKFIAVMGVLAGAETLRFTTHQLVLDHEFAAGAPWVTSVPENQHLVAKYAAIYAAELLVAYEIKKPHSWLPGDKVIRKFWWAFPAAMTVVHTKNGVRSIQTQAPSCPVEECSAQ
jgi:hypothetical protein